MLLHCDLVIAEEGARFSLPFVDLALVPEAASSLLLPRLAGRRRAARYLLLGEPSASTKPWTSASSATAPGPDSSTRRSRMSSSGCSPSPPARCARPSSLLRSGTREEILERMRLEGEVFAERLGSAEAKAAISAFFERREG